MKFFHNDQTGGCTQQAVAIRPPFVSERVREL